MERGGAREVGVGHHIADIYDDGMVTSCMMALLRWKTKASLR